MIDQKLSALDSQFARFLAERSGLSGLEKERFQELVGRVSSALEDGHSCLPVSQQDTDFLVANHLVSDGGRTPLVLHGGRLYLHRYYRYETRLAEQVKAMASKNFLPGRGEELADRYFVQKELVTDYWQKEAAKVALKKALTIICGGPGTGKTTTVVKILAVLLQSAESKCLPEVALAAPTGKAAMRLSESVGKSMKNLELPESIRKSLPVTACTLHRLLGVRRSSPQFRHNKENPMGWDIVVVDEASMVDLAMMSKLVDALKPGARLLLLGDKDQLASVESGAVLGDFIKSLPENTVELQKTYRFDTNIKDLAAAINRAESGRVWDLLTAPERTNTGLLATDPVDYFATRYARYMAAVYRPEPKDLRGIFSSFNSFRVLCGVHYGNRGVAGINRRVELSLSSRGFACRSETWYPGRPVLITRNDYGLDLYNGDIGICLQDPDAGDLKVWFERADGSLRSYSPQRLPQCETVFAMTIHKSQGSEFDEVVVIFPKEDNRILSRELIYTAVTRARKSVRLVVEQPVLATALSRSIERFSGLAELLTNGRQNIG